MQRSNRWLVGVLLIAAVQLAACGQTSAPTASHSQPAKVEHIDGTELSRVVLTPEAAKRLDIQTAAVSEEQRTRKRIVGGEIVSLPSSGVMVRVPLGESDLGAVDRSQPASILPLDIADKTPGITAKLIEKPAVKDPKDASTALYYAIDGKKSGLADKQRIRVELALTGSGKPQKVVPYSSVIYDLNGKTWAYTSPENLTYVRHPIDVDYIENDVAVLTDGPSSGTTVVVVGAAELFGTEFGVGH
jgi:membrane fusion protein, heavy metal efflux system